MKEIKMTVDGIMCVNCVNKITTALNGQNGCDSVIVSDDFSTVFVKYQEQIITADKIINTIENIKDKSFCVTEQEEIIR